MKTKPTSGAEPDPRPYPGRALPLRHAGVAGGRPGSRTPLAEHARLGRAPARRPMDPWELNPGLRLDEATLRARMVESPGVEPGFPRCERGVFPLDDDPVKMAPQLRIERRWTGLQPVALTTSATAARWRWRRDSNPPHAVDSRVASPDAYASEMGWRAGVEPALRGPQPRVQSRYTNATMSDVRRRGLEPRSRAYRARALGRWTIGGRWSGWPDSNRRSPAPEAGAVSQAPLHPVKMVSVRGFEPPPSCSPSTRSHPG